MRRRCLILAAAALASVRRAAQARSDPPGPAAARTTGETPALSMRWDATAGQLVVEDAGGTVRARLDALGADGRGRARGAEIHHLAVRRSFVVAFEGLAELWEVATDPAAPPVFEGLVHDYRMGEGLGQPGFLKPRRTRLPEPVRALGFDPERGLVLAQAFAPVQQGAAAPSATVWLIQLDVRRPLRRWVVAGDPDTAAAEVAVRDGHRVLRAPLRAAGPHAGAAFIADPWER